MLAHNRSIRFAFLLSGVMLAALLACNLSGISGFQTQDDCKNPLDEQMLPDLTISLGGGIPGTISLQPGATGEFSVGIVECCYIYNPVDACVTWSVEPTDGATIDPQTGQLSLDADVAAGSVFTVTADIEQGRHTLTTDVNVFTPEANPLVGRWREAGQFACGNGTEISPDPAIGELIFEADGSFSVTWFPFEVYVDYWGSYTYDLETRGLELEVTSGNYVPGDMDASGTFEFDEQGRLLLRDLWFGSPPDGMTQAGCGHVFIH